MVKIECNKENGITIEITDSKEKEVTEEVIEEKGITEQTNEYMNFVCQQRKILMDLQPKGLLFGLT